MLIKPNKILVTPNINSCIATNFKYISNGKNPKLFKLPTLV